MHCESDLITYRQVSGILKERDPYVDLPRLLPMVDASILETHTKNVFPFLCVCIQFI